MESELNIEEKNIQKQIEEGKIDALLSYIPFLCFIPLFKRNINQFAKKHVKQGLLLLIIEIIALFFLIEVVSKIFWSFVLISCFSFALIGISKVIAGKEMKIPFVGNIFEKYDI